MLLSQHLLAETTDFEPIVSLQVTFTGGSRVNGQIIPIISSSSTEVHEYFTVSLDDVMLLTSRTSRSLHFSN